MVRYWNCLCDMNDNRLTKIIFVWEYNIESKNWTNRLKSVLIEGDMVDHLMNLQKCYLQQVKETLLLNDVKTWKQDILNKPKLEFYKLLKSAYSCGKYVYENLYCDIRSCTSTNLCLNLTLGDRNWSIYQYTKRTKNM